MQTTNEETIAFKEKKTFKDFSEPVADTLIQRIQSGESQLYPELFDQCQPIIKRTTYRRYIKGYERDDLYQEACLVIVQASQKYECNKGMNFNQYVCLCIDNHFHRLIRWNNAVKRRSIRESLSLEGVIEENGYQLVGFSQAIQPEDKPIINETVEEYLCKLSTFEKEVCLNCYLGYSYDDIAEKLNCTRNKVVNAKHRCTEKYRKLFL